MSTKFRPENLTRRNIRVDEFFCGLFNDTVPLSTASFKILKLYILPPEISLTKHSVIGFHNRGGRCLLHGTN
jgi:hypothetical protein